MKNLNFKAILVGFIADFGVSQLLATFLGLAAVLLLPQARAMAMGGNTAGLTTFLSNWMPFLVMGLVCACVGEFMGGLVVGSLAPLHPRANAMATAGITILTSVLLLGSYPLWYRVIAIALVIPCYWLGAMWATKRNEAKAARQGLAAQNAPLSPPR